MQERSKPSYYKDQIQSLILNNGEITSDDVFKTFKLSGVFHLSINSYSNSDKKKKKDCKDTTILLMHNAKEVNDGLYVIPPLLGLAWWDYFALVLFLSVFS